jgi:hypothetical protein
LLNDHRVDYINFIKLENLKANKLAGGRHKDLNDLENLP